MLLVERIVSLFDYSIISILFEYLIILMFLSDQSSQTAMTILRCIKTIYLYPHSLLFKNFLFPISNSWTMEVVTTKHQEVVDYSTAISCKIETNCVILTLFWKKIPNNWHEIQQFRLLRQFSESSPVAKIVGQVGL